MLGMQATNNRYNAGLNILICYSDRIQAGILENLLRTAGHRPECIVAEKLPELLIEKSPDCLFVLHNPLNLNAMKLSSSFLLRAGCPLVIAAEQWDQKLAKEAISAGYDAFLGIPTTVNSIIITLLQAEAQHNRSRHLNNRVLELEQRLTERKLIEKAKGLLMEKQKLSEEQAFRTMRNESMHRRISMAALADELLRSVRP